MYAKIFCLLLGLSLVSMGEMYADNGMTIGQYIQKFKDLSIGEMDRSGIPASITLAQGILESSFGNSLLAREANNHFGIKCHTWEGKTYYIKDDDRDKNGNLIKSCFRSYDTPEESYYDHTEFLSKKGRYSFLFEYKRTDYKNWAKGLRQAGYATNKQYANLLIKVIETNKLAQYDHMTNEVIVYDPNKPRTGGSKPSATPRPNKPAPNTASTLATSSEFPVRFRKGIFYVNQVKAISAAKGDTPESLSQKHKVSLKKLLDYNDLKKGDKLLVNQYVFLQPKRKKYRDRKTYHKVKSGQTMYIIAQMHGLQLDELVSRNLLKMNEEPKVGARIYLNKSPRSKPAVYIPTKDKETRPLIKPTLTEPKPKEAPKPVAQASKPKPPVEKPGPTKPTISAKPATTPVKKPSQPSSSKDKPGRTYTAVTTKTADPNAIKDLEMEPVMPNVKTTPVPKTSTPPTKTLKKHVVQKGDTLYSLARMYKLSVKELSAKNKLENQAIKVGQVLVVE